VGEPASKLKKLKYDLCKEIEQTLGMEQRLRVGEARRWQDYAYIILLMLLLAAWVVLLVDVARL
jgi:hypothetical protein